MEYLTTEDLVEIATEITGSPAVVRDYGLLGSAAHRPQEFVFGNEVYPTPHLKAAALLEAIVRYHPLLDGNKRLGWTAMRIFYDLNGYTVTPLSSDAAVDFVVSVVVNHTDVAEVAKQLESWAHPRSDDPTPSS